MVEIHDVFLLRTHQSTFSPKEWWILRGMVPGHDFFLLHLLRSTFSTQKQCMVGGMVRIHDFYYFAFTVPDVQLMDGAF